MKSNGFIHINIKDTYNLFIRHNMVDITSLDHYYLDYDPRKNKVVIIIEQFNDFRVIKRLNNTHYLKYRVISGLQIFSQSR